MDENSIIMKQELLKREILDKKYSKEKFVEYCLSIKQDGDDFSSWNIEDLENIVKKFQEINVDTNSSEKLEEIKIEKPQIVVENIEISVYMCLLETSI